MSVRGLWVIRRTKSGSPGYEVLFSRSAINCVVVVISNVPLGRVKTLGDCIFT